jgi:hypothetical protein
MDAFAKFALRLVYPPNPIASFDGTLTAVQAQGAQLYNNVVSDRIAQCNGCHVLNPALGRFGTDGTMSIEGPGIDEDMKIPHLRNMYQKVGMFARNTQVPGTPHLGDQIRGFGYDHSGAAGTLAVFLSESVFTLTAAQRAQIEQFVLAFPSDLAPIVGQQLTMTAANAGRADVQARLSLLMARALVLAPRPECELVVRGVIGGQAVGWVMNRSQRFAPDLSGAPDVSLQELLNQAQAAGSNLTFTCTPPGNGTRIGVDRDGDGVLDRSDPSL